MGVYAITALSAAVSSSKEEHQVVTTILWASRFGPNSSSISCKLVEEEGGVSGSAHPYIAACGCVGHYEA